MARGAVSASQLRRIRLLATAAVVTLLAWPVADLTPCGGIDCSWMFALHASLHGYYAGIPVDSFTYGPLGALSAPILFFRSTALLAVGSLALVQFATVLLALRRAERLLHPVVAAVLVLLIARTLSILTAETASIAVVLVGAEVAERRPQRRGLLLILGAGVVGFLLLMKASTGLLALATAIVLGFALGGPSLARRVMLAGLSLLASLAWCFVIFTAVTGQPGSFESWARGSYDEATGFTALALEDPGRGGEYVVAAALILAMFALAVRLRREPQLLTIVVLLALGILVKVREGFVRHDGHVAVFLSAVGFLVLALPLRRALLDQLAAVAIPVSCVIALVAASVSSWSGLADLAAGPRGAVKVGRQLLDPAVARATEDSGRAQIMATDAVPSSLVSLLGRHPVEVDPYQTAAVDGYGLIWGPTAQYADYQSYTPYLDRANAASLSGDTGRRILRPDADVTVDNHFSPWDSPVYQLAVLCSWHEIARAGAWQVLAPGPQRCGATSPLETVGLRPGQTTGVPKPRRPGDIVVLRLTLSRSVLDRLATAALKPLGPTWVVLDGRRFRLVTATAGGPLMVRVPEDLPAGPGSPDVVDVSTLAVTGDVTRITASFSEIAVR